MSGPLTREERKELGKEEIADIDWDNEESLALGERKDPEPRDFEPEDRWAFTREPVTREERKKMVGKLIEVAIKATFKNHIYL